MDFEGIGMQRKEEMFFNIILPFLMVFSDDEGIQKTLQFMFEEYPALKDNSRTKKFKSRYPHINITTAREYMGVMLFSQREYAHK
jgi:hypothetical protein